MSGLSSGLGTAVLRITVNTQNANKILRSINTSLLEMKNAAMVTNRMLREMNKNLVTMTKGVKTGGKELDTAAVKARKFSTALKNVGMNLVSVGRKSVFAGVALAAMFAPIIIEGAKFEQIMSQVQAVVQGTIEQFESLNVKARELGATTVFTASQVAAGMRFLGVAGLETGQILGGISDVLNLAAAGGIELAQAADVAANSLNAFQLRAEDLNRVTDAFAAAAANSNQTISQLSEALKFATPAAAALGQRVEDVIAVLSALANTGIRASIAGTGLNRILIQLIAKQEKVNEVLAKYGKTFEDVNPEIVSIIDIIRTFRDINLSAADSAKLFGLRASRAILALKNVSERSFRDIKASIEDSFGEALNQAIIRMDNFSGRVIEFKSRFEGIAISIFDTFKKSLTGTLDNINQTLVSINNWIKANRNIVAGIVSVVGIVSVLLVV